MNAEQKQQAKQLIADWTNVSKTSTPAVWFLNGDCMAGFLQELVKAPEPEPVAWQVRNGWASVAIYQRRIDAENYAKDQQKRHDLSGSLASFCVVPLYTAPPAPSVPDGWKLVPVEPTPEPFGYFKAEPFGWTDCAETDDGAIALFDAPPAPTPAEAPADVARDAELLRKLKHSIGQAKISGNDWRRELELMSSMIDAAMSEKGGA